MALGHGEELKFQMEQYKELSALSASKSDSLKKESDENYRLYLERVEETKMLRTQLRCHDQI